MNDNLRVQKDNENLCGLKTFTETTKKIRKDWDCIDAVGCRLEAMRDKRDFRSQVCRLYRLATFCVINSS